MNGRADVYIGLGSNLNEPVRQLDCGVQGLADLADSELLAVSSYYQNPALPVPAQPPQPDYVNAVARLRTGLTPEQLLRDLQALERRQGRRPTTQRWLPRTLDLDILLFGDRSIDLPRLKVPHPGLPQRAFVLYPLHELCPELNIPGVGSLADLLAACKGSTLLKLTRL